jgi:DNA-binding NarL/FixJ family response regulator
MSGSAYTRDLDAHEAISYVPWIAALSIMDIVWLQALSEGKQMKDCAVLGQTSLPMVKKRMRSVRLFLGAKNTVQAVAIALRKGLIK